MDSNDRGGSPIWIVVRWIIQFHESSMTGHSRHNSRVVLDKSLGHEASVGISPNVNSIRVDDSVGSLDGILNDLIEKVTVGDICSVATGATAFIPTWDRRKRDLIRALRPSHVKVFRTCPFPPTCVEWTKLGTTSESMEVEDEGVRSWLLSSQARWCVCEPTPVLSSYIGTGPSSRHKGQCVRAIVTVLLPFPRYETVLCSPCIIRRCHHMIFFFLKVSSGRSNGKTMGTEVGKKR